MFGSLMEAMMKTTRLVRQGIGALMALLLAATAVPVVAEEDTVRKFWHDGWYREYQYYVPPSAGPGSPALLMLHGHTEKINGFWAGDDMHRLADEKGMVLIYAQGEPSLELSGWNAGGICCGVPVLLNVNDNGFLRAVIKDVTQRVGLDRSRIYVAGHSNGAIMAHYLALRSHDLIAGIAPISFALQDNWSKPLPASWHPPRPMPVHAYHSIPDPFVTYHAGFLLYNGLPTGLTTTTLLWLNSAEEGIAKWAEINGCGALTRTERGYPGLWIEDRPNPEEQNANYFSYADCGYGVPNNLVALYQGDHSGIRNDNVTGLQLQRDVWARLSVLSKPGHEGSELWQGMDLALKNGQRLRSENGAWTLAYDSASGRLLVTDAAGNAAWSHAAPGASRLVINGGAVQAIRDGYWREYTVRKCAWFVCWNETKWEYVPASVVWQSTAPTSQPAYRPDWRLTLSDDGVLAMTDAMDQVIWRSH